MLKTSEYLQHARACRALAARMELAEQREQLLEMAAHWDQLAADRDARARRAAGRGEEPSSRS